MISLTARTKLDNARSTSPWADPQRPSSPRVWAKEVRSNAHSSSRVMLAAAVTGWPSWYVSAMPCSSAQASSGLHHRPWKRSSDGRPVRRSIVGGRTPGPGPCAELPGEQGRAGRDDHDVEHQLHHDQGPGELAGGVDVTVA